MQPRVDPNSLAIDGSALNGLKNAKSDSPEAIRAVARQFEGVLMNMMLKSMRDTVPQDGITDNEQSKMFMGMLDQQLTTQLSQKGMGLTEVLVRQLSKFSPKPAEDTEKTKTQLHGTKNDLVNGLSSSNPSLSNLASSGTASGKAVLMQAAQKIRDAYQQWEATKPETASTDNDSAWARGIPELPPLMEETQENAKNFTLPQAAPLATAMSEVASKTQQFIQRMLPHAQAASSDSGIPAKFMIGQAALESGWGKHEIKTTNGVNSHNLFGIKADASWKGKVANSVTTEYINGVKETRVEKFRAYDSYSDAFKDYAKLISQNPRYEKAMNNTHDASAYAHELQRAGYATDPQYGKKLTQVIKHLQS
ncbi:MULTISPECIES: flagellar assembly peptidoglycan hydrolase FlgJ [unclassified Methylophilus]|uniref:flagellar assembly peptidoglycan hydrolase FlgJ n=1 Tax=unclassified Methylophilus TaxID=2630143 RepID=UPI0006F26BE8|nr:MULTISPECIES: flagellar assembly peptidoglycan hydrolase FlgJ [unclassified Methylophilus]KQT37193.1 flagellar rod assembly protein/muramidase FlgJ [Methylophilus sp. Leaf416]KQT55637.1 flagellar rod assembly protein/muramidase FlgJ [Methylophilus sp. Leaf459]